MKTILLTNHYEGKPLEILQSAIAGRFRLMMLDEVTQENLKEKISEADYLLVSGRLKISADVLERAERLVMVQRTGVGLDNMDMEYMSKHNIPLYVNRGVNANSVAEHSLFLILSVLRRSYFVNVQIRKGIWRKQQTGLTTHELQGKTVGIVGMGEIGRRVSDLLQPFGVKCLYYDMIRLSSEEEIKKNLTYCEFNQLLEVADIVTLHCGMSKDNRHLISTEQLHAMKDGSVLINTARGGLIDTSALVTALENGKLMGVGIDTFEEEPIKENNALLKFDNAILSPHIGGVSYEAFQKMMSLALENIVAYDENRLEDIKKNRRV